MPLRGYLLYVSGALVALLLATNLYIPRQAQREEAPHAYNIQITAPPNPNRPVTFSGETRNFGEPPPMTVVDFAEKAQPHVAQAAAPARGASRKVVAKAAPARTARAHPHATVTAQREARPARTRVARRRTGPENSYAQIPDEWRHRYTVLGPGMGMAYARPFTW